MIKGVYFDWGGVLIENPSYSLMSYMAKYFDKTELEMRTILDCNKELFNKYQKGEVEETALWEEIFNIKGINVWKAAVKNSFKVHTEVLAFAEELKSQGIKIGVLSNTENEAVENFSNFFDKEFFDYTVFSCDVKLVKPEKAIYEHAVTLMGFKSNEILFIDDREDFVEGARTCKIHAYMYDNVSDILKIKDIYF